MHDAVEGPPGGAVRSRDRRPTDIPIRLLPGVVRLLGCHLRAPRACQPSETSMRCSTFANRSHRRAPRGQRRGSPTMMNASCARLIATLIRRSLRRKPSSFSGSRACARASACRRRTALSCESTSAAADRCPRGPERCGAARSVRPARDQVPAPRGGSNTRTGPERVLSHRWSSEPLDLPGAGAL